MHKSIAVEQNLDDSKLLPQLLKGELPGLTKIYIYFVTSFFEIKYGPSARYSNPEFSKT